MPEYEVGADRGVLYLPGQVGEPWVGLTEIIEAPTDVNETVIYIDGVKNRSRRNRGSFAGTIEAFTYPDSFYENVLIQERRQDFGLSYRVLNGENYKIHLIYNISISPAGISRKQFDIDPFAWDFTTTPLDIPGAKSSSHLIIDSSKAYPWTIAALEDILYGSDAMSSRLPLPLEVLSIFDDNSILKVVDNGDGSFTVTGPDEAIEMLDSTTFQITWPSAIYIDETSYTISSL